ncbi:MAG TPA: alpha/beta hydrolase [Thermoanaerobaculia bacterium]|jgi:pimeloyl-ACP methyl ester carboxylesterase
MIATLLAAVLTLELCEVRGVAAECGKVPVPENRRVSGGRSIDLSIAIVRAEKRHRDAVFVLAGGPGVGATNMTPWAVETFAAGERDLVLVDARGTGGSNALKCDPPSTAYGDLWELARIEACREQLAKRADLTQYTTRQVVEDLEVVRKKLGYRKVTLYGTSYGTRVAQEYMRRYPNSIRAVILDGVVPPSLAMPANYAEYSERTLQRVLDLCKADEACRTAYPGLDADLQKMLAAAKKGVTIEQEPLGRGYFGEAFRNFLYSPEVYVKLPKAIHAAAHGDWAPYAEMAGRYSRSIRAVDLGFFLSVTCAEDLPRVDEQQIRRGSAGTVLGTYRLDQQLGACKVWPRAEVDPASFAPVRSSIPTLLVSGELDPVTPPEYGDEVAKGLAKSLHVVIPAGSHSGDTGGCLEKVLSEFIREGSVAALDTTCMKDVRRPPFVTK